MPAPATVGKSALAVVLIFSANFIGDSTSAGRAEARPLQMQASGAPGQLKKSARVTKTAEATRYDHSQALRDLPPKAPRRDREELEMRKPRPMHGTPRKPARGRQPDPVVQSSPAPAPMPSFSANFEGVGNVNGVLPPDTNGAVGPNHYVQWVNLSFAVYSKAGVKLYGPADGSTLWTGFGGPCEENNNGDPIVMHDDLADRWVMSQLALPFFPFGPFIQCVAVSQTADPIGAYHRYEFTISEAKLNDYPKLGVWPDGYYMAVNQFDAITSAWQGQGVVAFEREKMLRGAAARMIYFDLFDLDPDLGAMLPAHVDGAAPPPGAPNIFVQFDDDGLVAVPQDQLQLWSFHADWNNPANSTFTGPVILPVAAFDSNLCNYSRNCIPQAGTNARVDSIPDRLMYRLQYRNFGSHSALVVNHTVDAGGDLAGIRWYEIREPFGAAVIHQQGTYAPDSEHRWMGSVAMDGAGNMALGFSVSSSTLFPSIRYAGRLAGDPLGTMAQGESELMAGSGAQTHNTGRWGDYSSMSVDPNDHCTFWYTQQYYTSVNQSDWQTRVGAFSFPSCAMSLPSVTVSAESAPATEAGLVSRVFTVSRTGATDADLLVNFWVSGTATAGSDYASLPTSVTIPIGAASATVVVTPLDDLAVEQDETVTITLAPDAAYSAGSPSSASVVIVSDDLPSDMVVTSVTAPVSSGAGATITVTETTKNQGGGPADASTTRLYLSTNTLVDAGDAVLGERAVASLAPGASSTASSSVTIPANTTGGSYYLIAKADADDANVESSETNNLKYVVILVGPDMAVNSLTTPATSGAGVSFSLSDTTKNQGGGAAGASVTRFYLSTNTTIEAGDAVLGERAVPALAPGTTNSGSTSVTIPPGTAGGNYYLIARADADGAVAETAENNNLRYNTIKIGSDLAVTALTGPAASAASAAITLNETTKNQGGAPAGASVTRFYFSINAALDSGDTVLGERAIPALAAGASNAGTVNATIPAGATPGTRYIIAKADANNAVSEYAETNNTRVVGIAIGPDMAVTALTAPSATGAGVSITLNETTKNQGGDSAAATITRFYLSPNSTLDAGDAVLGQRSIPALAAGTSNAGATSVTIPAGTSSGTKYIIAKADDDNAVSESSETNNLRTVTIQIGPDLAVTALTAPGPVVAGGNWTIFDTTKNQGVGASGASTTRFYLSTNTALDASDIELGGRVIAALDAGASSAGSTVVVVPAGTAPGTYYLIAKADADLVVGETQEANNMRIVLVTITAN